MEESAKAYDDLSQIQVKLGYLFTSELNLSKGAKVLDMGCGTGNVTKYIADIVGSDGQVVGVDPDDARIKIAVEKYKEINHLEFHIGNSVTRFPHDNEPYYEFHVSTSVFHWILNDEKRTYLQKAYKCLKPGGKLGILCAALTPDELTVSLSMIPLTEDGFCKLFNEVGLFKNVVIKRILIPHQFKTYDAFRRWFKATCYQEFEEVHPACWNEYVIKEEDGSVTYQMPRIAITAVKH